MKAIGLIYYGSSWHAYLKDDVETWARGASVDEAIGRLVHNNPAAFSVEVDWSNESVRQGLREMRQEVDRMERSHRG